jgi:hypothetical protein
LKLRSKILFILVLLLVLGFIFVMPHGRYRHALEAYKKELLAKGEKLTIAELAPPPPSANASNGAKAFMQLMRDYKPPTNDYPYMMRMAVPGLGQVGHTNLALVDMFNYEQNLGKVAKLRDVLKAPVLNFDLDYSQGFDLPLAHLVKLKQAEQLTACAAMQAYYAKNFPEARADLLTAVDLVRVYTNDPLMISGLVRIAMTRIALNATWEGLQSDEWTGPQLAELQDKWQGMNLFENSATVITFERACGIAEIAKLREAPNADSLALANPSFAPSGTPADNGVLDNFTHKIGSLYYHLRFSIWKSSWSYDEELCLLQVEQALIETARNANAKGAFVPAFKKLDQQASNIFQLHPDATNHFLFGELNDQVFVRYLQKLAQAETARRLCVTAIALKRYHLQHSAYPATLDDLVPAILPAVPVDFMDGKPLRYKLRPDGDFLLYSVGEDGQDNGGDPTPASQSISSTSFNWLTSRDIVWPRVATPAALEEYHRLSQSMTNSTPRPKP